MELEDKDKVDAAQTAARMLARYRTNTTCTLIECEELGQCLVEWIVNSKTGELLEVSFSEVDNAGII